MVGSESATDPVTALGQTPRLSPETKGIGRLGYVCISMVQGCLVLCIREMTVHVEEEFYTVLIFLGILVISVPVLAAYRFRNMCVSRWYGLFALVPITNLIVAMVCLVCPTGYGRTRKLDAVGRVLCATIIGSIILIPLGCWYIKGIYGL